MFQPYLLLKLLPKVLSIVSSSTPQVGLERIEVQNLLNEGVQ